MTALGKTPWVDRSLRSLHDALQYAVPPEWLPRFDVLGKVEEFGCGHYGCVMPTSAEGLVCKLTTDVSEAHFVARALMLEPTSGIVEYKKILWAPALKHRGRPVFVLWRSEAFSVGDWRYEKRRHQMTTDLNMHYAWAVTGEANRLLEQFIDWGRVARQYVYRHLQRVEREYGPRYFTFERQLEERHKLLTAVWATYERMDPVSDLPQWRVRKSVV